jgi:hypothetical protein
VSGSYWRNSEEQHGRDSLDAKALLAIWIMPTIMVAASSVRYTLMARLKQAASTAAVIIGSTDSL